MFENLNFGQNFRKIAILVKIRENFKFGHTFRKKLDFIRNISISVQISESLDFG